MEELKADFPDWHVTIIGNGEVERFQAMAQTMGLDDSVVSVRKMGHQAFTA